MGDVKSLLDRALDGFAPAAGGLEGTLVRVRRSRRRRVAFRAAGALVVIGGLVAALAIVAGHRDRRVSTPPAATTSPAGWSTSRDLADGLSISYPRPWRPAISSLTPALVDPRVPIALGTYPLRPQRLGECDIVPQRALEALGPHDAFVAIYVYDGMATGDFRAHRPARFGPDLPWVEQHIQCTQNVHGHLGTLNFTDGGRHLSLLVAYGAKASTKRRHELYRILDTLTVTPAS